MSEKTANVDLRGDSYFVGTYSLTEVGYWVSDGKPIQLPATASTGELGAAIREALDASREDAPLPPKDTSPAQLLLDAAGVTSYAAFMKGTKQVEVYAEDTQDGERIEVTPKKNGGGREGFEPMTDQTATFAYDSPGQIGEAVLRAFEAATE